MSILVDLLHISLRHHGGFGVAQELEDIFPDVGDRFQGVNRSNQSVPFLLVYQATARFWNWAAIDITMFAS